MPLTAIEELRSKCTGPLTHSDASHLHASTLSANEDIDRRIIPRSIGLACAARVPRISSSRAFDSISHFDPTLSTPIRTALITPTNEKEAMNPKIL